MPALEEHLQKVVDAGTWNDRVAGIRRAQMSVAPNDRAEFFGDLAEVLYTPPLVYSFETVYWRDDFAQSDFDTLYALADVATKGFTCVTEEDLGRVIGSEPAVVRVFRAILGYTRPELAAAATAASAETHSITQSRVIALEAGRSQDVETCVRWVARAISIAMTEPRTALTDGAPATKQSVQHDTRWGWSSVRKAHEFGVPYAVLLNQRLVGGAFRQLQDATSTQVGGGLELPVRALLDAAGIAYVRTTTSAQDKAEVALRFGINLDLVPDYVVHDGSSLRAFLECKLINDGGTARDKAARFKNYRTEGQRLGGIPVFAVVDGAGWRRTSDALGPVVDACDGRVFSLKNVEQMLHVDPLASLVVSNDEAAPS